MPKITYKKTYRDCFNAFTDGSSKRQGTYVLYTNSTCSTKKDCTHPWLYSSKFILSVFNQFLLDISQSFDILTPSSIYLKANDHLLGGLRKNRSLPVMMGISEGPVRTSSPEMGILQEIWGSTLMNFICKLAPEGSRRTEIENQPNLREKECCRKLADVERT